MINEGQVNVTTEDIVPMMTVGGGRTWVRVAVILEEILTSGPPRMIDGTIDSDPLPRTVGNVTILGLYLRYHAVGVLGANKISGARVRSIEVVETLPRSQIRGDRLISGTLRMPRSVNEFNNRVVNTDENHTLQLAHDRARYHPPPSLRNNDPPNFDDIEEVIAASKFVLFKKPDCNKPVVGFNVVYEGEDEKTDLIDSNSVQVGDIWEIHEMGPTGNRDAFLGDGKTTPSSGGLHSSKTTRVVVTGGTGERRTGFRITSCNNTLQEKIKKSGEVSRYFLIHVEGRPPPSNTAGLPTLRVSSSAYWMAFSAMDTENIVTFRPDNVMRSIGRAHIADVQRAVQQRSQQDIIGVSTLAQTFQATNPYGRFPPSSSLSNSAVANPTPPGVQPAQPQTAHPNFNPPTGPRAEFRRSDRLRTQPPPDYRDTGRRQGATGPASQPAPQTITHPPPARPTLPSGDQAVQDLRGATNGRSPAQRSTETGQPRTNGTDTKRKRDDSEDGPRKNRRRGSI
ncbi:uncharacterized protein J4E78_006572 [Alternaria triticimaculans]|uniref:uncharacterized protein n=1 Tax=Alternaria triticimaculans TaxID=297637 RepID=UPI0020C1D60A|nr:uncharacterized protein J4E78_006572 [Alternaria triticimaculans]KAI4656681.1 hypothetical protein J4E78_006572 [Alternaria triticimaculans]